MCCFICVCVHLLLEQHKQQCEEVRKAKESEENARMTLREKEIELVTLHKYFKDTESDLHRSEACAKGHSISEPLAASLV